MYLTQMIEPDLNLSFLKKVNEKLTDKKINSKINFKMW